MATTVPLGGWSPPPPRRTVVNSKVMVVAVAVLFIVVLFILCLHIYAKWFWRNHATATIVTSDGTAHTLSWRRRRSAFVHNPADGAPPHSVGLERAVVESLPTFEFSGEEGRKLECAVCLEDFEQGEQGRTLPKCGHDFHLECIDMWLHSHSTCPLCRTGVAADGTKPSEPIAGAPFMAAMRASRQRQRSLNRTAPDPENPPVPETVLPQEDLKENDSTSSSSRAPFEVTIDIPRGGGVSNPASVMSPMARASASFRRLLSRGKSVVTPQSDDGVGPSSSPPSPPSPPPPPPPPIV